MCCQSLQSCLNLQPHELLPRSMPDPSVFGMFQARMLEWVSMSSCRGSSRPRDRTHIFYISCIGRWVLYHQQPWEAQVDVCFQSVTILSNEVLGPEKRLGLSRLSVGLWSSFRSLEELGQAPTRITQFSVTGVDKCLVFTYPLEQRRL